MAKELGTGSLCILPVELELCWRWLITGAAVQLLPPLSNLPQLRLGE